MAMALAPSAPRVLIANDSRLSLAGCTGHGGSLGESPDEKESAYDGSDDYAGNGPAGETCAVATSTSATALDCGCLAGREQVEGL